MHIGIHIKMARIAHGLTQEQLAEKIHKTRPLVSHIEQTGKVNSITLKSIGEVLNFDPEKLMEEVGEPPLTYFPSTLKIRELEEQIRYLTNENETLRQLVKSQEEVIALMKEKK